MKKFVLILLMTLVIAAAARADTITLKDDQEFAADVVSFDKFYLEVKLADGKDVSIPWAEVREVKHTTTPSNWLEETYITPEAVEVKTLIAPLSPSTAFFRALNPGILIHGSGHFYAKDTNMGMSLLSGEIVSLIVMGISLAEIMQPADNDESYTVSKVVMYCGVALFGGSWLYDLIFSGPAADRFNRENTFISGGPDRDAGSAGK
jgi:hypothetical protein